MSSNNLAKVVPGKTASGHLPQNYPRSIPKIASAMLLKGDNWPTLRPRAAPANWAIAIFLLARMAINNYEGLS